MRRPRVEFLWWSECPSWQRALDGLRAQMEAGGLDPASIERIEIREEADAERERFLGSPTIRVDGEDVEPVEAGQPTGLACRVYRRPDGRVSPLPDPERVATALSRAADRAD